MSMTREEYARLMELAGDLFVSSPPPRTVEAWRKDLERFTLADAEDALRRLARSHEKLPSLSVLLAEVRVVRRNRPRHSPPVANVWSESERDRLLRYARLVANASRAGRLEIVQHAMALATSARTDPLDAGEAAMRGHTVA